MLILFAIVNYNNLVQHEREFFLMTPLFRFVTDTKVKTSSKWLLGCRSWRVEWRNADKWHLDADCVTQIGTSPRSGLIWSTSEWFYKISSPPRERRAPFSLVFRACGRAGQGASARAWAASNRNETRVAMATPEIARIHRSRTSGAGHHTQKPSDRLTVMYNEIQLWWAQTSAIGLSSLAPLPYTLLLPLRLGEAATGGDSTVSRARHVTASTMARARVDFRNSHSCFL